MSDLTNNTNKELYAKVAQSNPELLEKLLRPINKNGLSWRSINCLLSNDIVHIGDLAIISQREFLSSNYPNIGRLGINELKTKILEPLGLELGMDLPFWPLRNSWQAKNPKYEEAISGLTSALEEVQKEAEKTHSENSHPPGTHEGSRRATEHLRKIIEKRTEARALRGMAESRGHSR